MAEEEPPLYEDNDFAVGFTREVDSYIKSFDASFETTLVKKNETLGRECHIYTIKNISGVGNYVLKAFFNKDDYEHELRMTILFWGSSSPECAPYFNMVLIDDIPETSPETPHNKPRFSIIMNFFPRMATERQGILDIKNLDHLITLNRFLRDERYYYNILKNFIMCLRDLNKKNIFHRDLKYDNIIFVKWSEIDQESEKGIHLIDYGSALELKDIFGLEDLVEGLTPQNIFPLYIFLEIFGKEEKFHETYSYILQAHEIWTFILTLFNIMVKIPENRSGKKRSDMHLLDYTTDAISPSIQTFFRCNVKRLSMMAPQDMPRQMYIGLMSYAINVPSPKSSELKFIFPEEVFNSSNLEIFSKKDGKLFNPNIDITPGNTDEVQQKVMDFCMAYVTWFDNNLDEILKGILRRVLKPQPNKVKEGGEKGSLKKTKRKKTKRKKRKKTKKKPKRKKLKTKKTKKKPKKTKRKRRR